MPLGAFPLGFIVLFPVDAAPPVPSATATAVATVEVGGIGRAAAPRSRRARRGLNKTGPRPAVSRRQDFDDAEPVIPPRSLESALSEEEDALLLLVLVEGPNLFAKRARQLSIQAQPPAPMNEHEDAILLLTVD